MVQAPRRPLPPPPRRPNRRRRPGPPPPQGQLQNRPRPPGAVPVRLGPPIQRLARPPAQERRDTSFTDKIVDQGIPLEAKFDMQLNGKMKDSYDLKRVQVANKRRRRPRPQQSQVSGEGVFLAKLVFFVGSNRPRPRPSFPCRGILSCKGQAKCPQSCPRHHLLGLLEDVLSHHGQLRSHKLPKTDCTKKQTLPRRRGPLSRILTSSLMSGL